MNDYMSIIVKIVVSVLLVIISRYLIPYLKSLYDDVKWKKFLDMVYDAVDAAEQIIKEPKSGEQKKEMVVSFIKEYLSKLGVTVTEEELNILIEAAVKRMNDKSQYITIEEA